MKSQYSAKANPRPDTPNPLPFAPIPHEATLDPAINAGDRDLLSRLLSYAQTANFCFPTNGELMADLQIGRRTVQDRLGRLESAGWIKCQYNDAKRRIRVRIDLLWRAEIRTPGVRLAAHPHAEIRTPLCDNPHTPCADFRTPSYKKQQENRNNNNKNGEDVVVSSQIQNWEDEDEDEDEDDTQALSEYLFGHDDGEPTVEYDADGEPLADDTYGFLDWLTQDMRLSSQND